MYIKNGIIVDAKGVREKDFSIYEGRISFDKDKSGEVIDAKGKIIMPAFYNTHTHIAMNFLKNIGEGLCLHDWLSKKIWPAEEKVDEKTLYYSSLLGFVEAMKSGTACINDMYLKGLESIAKASSKSGLRAVISYGMIDLHSDVDKELKKTRDFLKKDLEGIKKAVACHAPYTCSEELIIEGKNLANEEGRLFHIHVSETREEVFQILKEKGLRPVEYMDRINAIKGSIFAHASWVTKKEIKLIGNGGAVSHNPVSNLKLATGGILPFHEYEEAGALVTIGTDGSSSNNNLDMVESIKIAGLLQKHKYWDPTKGDPYSILKASTLNGAKALGFNAGTIEEGKLADFVIIDPKENMFPFGDYYTSIVFSMKRDNIEKLIVGGELIYDKKPLRVKEEEIEKAKKEVQKFLEKIGY